MDVEPYFLPLTKGQSHRLSDTLRSEGADIHVPGTRRERFRGYLQLCFHRHESWENGDRRESRVSGPSLLPEGVGDGPDPTRLSSGSTRNLETRDVAETRYLDLVVKDYRSLRLVQGTTDRSRKDRHRPKRL